LTRHRRQRAAGTATGDAVVTRLAITVTRIIDPPTSTAHIIDPPSLMAASIVQECGVGVVGAAGAGAGAGGDGNDPAPVECRTKPPELDLVRHLILAPKISKRMFPNRWPVSSLLVLVASQSTE